MTWYVYVRYAVLSRHGQELEALRRSLQLLTAPPGKSPRMGAVMLMVTTEPGGQYNQFVTAVCEGVNKTTAMLIAAALQAYFNQKLIRAELEERAQWIHARVEVTLTDKREPPEWTYMYEEVK